MAPETKDSSIKHLWNRRHPNAKCLPEVQVLPEEAPYEERRKGMGGGGGGGVLGIVLLHNKGGLVRLYLLSLSFSLVTL